MSAQMRAPVTEAAPEPAEERRDEAAANAASAPQAASAEPETVATDVVDAPAQPVPPAREATEPAPVLVEQPLAPTPLPVASRPARPRARLATLLSFTALVVAVASLPPVWPWLTRAASEVNAGPEVRQTMEEWLVAPRLNRLDHRLNVALVQVDQLDRRIAQLPAGEGRDAAPATTPSVAQGAALALAPENVAGLLGDIALLRMQFGQLASVVQETVAGQQARVAEIAAALEVRSIALERQNAEAVARLDAAAALLGQRIDALAASVASGREELEKDAANAKQVVLTLSDSFKQARSTDRRMTLALALQSVAQDGRPFYVEADLLRQSTDDPVLLKSLDAILPYARRGAPSTVELRDAIEQSEFVDSVLRAASGELTLWTRANRAVSRSLAEVGLTRAPEGLPTERLVAQAQIAMMRGQLADAVAILQKAEGAPATLLAPWITRAKARLQIDNALQAITGRVVNPS